MPTEAYRRLITFTDSLLTEYEQEYLECLARVNHYPAKLPGIEPLKCRLEVIGEHIEKLKAKRGELVEQAADQDRHIRRSGLLDKRSLR